MAELAKYRSKMQFEPGHFYSPVASQEEVVKHFSRLEQTDSLDTPGIELNLDAQMRWYQQFEDFYAEHPFTEKASGSVRYYLENKTFPGADALLLYCMIRQIRPKRIVEVGSGFSSAVMLDTNERFCESKIQLTFIEPYPERLHSLLSDSDRERVRIIATPIQDMLEAPWTDLQENDFLFIDSSHVSKCGSDVNRLFFEVIPSLNPGVIIHVHDVFPKFEYPEKWHHQGRSWNEDYLLRAFLQFNTAFEILVWGPLCIQSNPDYFQNKMPLLARNSGGSFWMKRCRA